MITRICLILALLAAVPGWSQTAGTDEQPDNPVANSGMLTPPPVSGEAYPVATGDEVRNNYINLGIAGQIGYDDNVAAGYSSKPASDTIFSIWPTVTFDKETLQLKEQFNYSPGFSFYEPTTTLNESDQNATANFDYHPSHTSSISLQDSFLRSSTLFSQPFAGGLGDVSGSTPAQVTGVVPPFADRISNAASLQLSDEAQDNLMFGVGAQYGQLDYPDSSQVVGLYNSVSYGGSAFMSIRSAARQYVGGNIQHTRIISYLKGTDSTLQSDNFFAFYTIYLRNSPRSTLSLSFTGGPEHYIAMQYPEASVQAWSPAGTVAVGWQAHLSSLSASYSHNVAGGGGLPGAYTEDRLRGLFRRELTHTWAANFSGLYSLNQNLTSSFPSSEPGGHTISFSASAEHTVNRNLKYAFGYDRVDETYTGVGAFANLPGSNHEYFSISYQMTRPLGR